MELIYLMYINVIHTTWRWGQVVEGQKLKLRHKPRRKIQISKECAVKLLNFRNIIRIFGMSSSVLLVTANTGTLFEKVDLIRDLLWDLQEVQKYSSEQVRISFSSWQHISRDLVPFLWFLNFFWFYHNYLRSHDHAHDAIILWYHKCYIIKVFPLILQECCASTHYSYDIAWCIEYPRRYRAGYRVTTTNNTRSGCHQPHRLE